MTPTLPDDYFREITMELLDYCRVSDGLRLVLNCCFGPPPGSIVVPTAYHLTRCRETPLKLPESNTPSGRNNCVLDC